MKRDAITAFWFPFPLNKRIRFIITSYGRNDAIQYFDKMDCRTITIKENNVFFDKALENKKCLSYLEILWSRTT
jgi:hypothetical protein